MVRAHCRAPAAGSRSASVSATKAGFSDCSNFKRVLGFHDHLPAFPRLEPGEHDAQPHARPGRHGGQKANLVDPVFSPAAASLGMTPTCIASGATIARVR